MRVGEGVSGWKPSVAFEPFEPQVQGVPQQLRCRPPVHLPPVGSLESTGLRGVEIEQLLQPVVVVVGSLAFALVHVLSREAEQGQQ